MGPKSKKRSSEYQSDDGFVIDGDDQQQHKSSKKLKTTTDTKPGPSSSSSNQKIDSNGDVYWDISSHRRVTVSTFRGRSMVNIREYYEKDGQELPGKKGISLPIDQFSALIDHLPEIEQALSAKGISVPRPSYNGTSDDQENDDEDRSPSNGKKNIDTTSDEDEDDD